MGSTVSISMIWGPGASASNSGARSVFASTSVTTDESSIGCGPSFRLCLLDNRDTIDAGLRTGSISMSSLEPLL